MNHTVKVIASVSLLTAAIIGTSLIAQRTLYTSSGDLEKRIDVVESSTGSSDWKSAEQNLLQIQDKWSHMKGTWAVLVDHQEIDNIDATLSRMQKFVQSRDTSSALAEASALKQFVRHIPRKDTLNIENIF